MSEQPKIQFPVNGGYWQILAHSPRDGSPRYSADLYIAGKVLCSVFGHDDTYTTDFTEIPGEYSLWLDSACISLGSEHNFELANQFLADTASHVGATA